MRVLPHKIDRQVLAHGALPARLEQELGPWASPGGTWRAMALLGFGLLGFGLLGSGGHGFCKGQIAGAVNDHLELITGRQ